MQESIATVVCPLIEIKVGVCKIIDHSDHLALRSASSVIHVYQPLSTPDLFTRLDIHANNRLSMYAAERERRKGEKVEGNNR